MKKTPLFLGVMSLLLFSACKKDLKEPSAEAEQDATPDQMFKSDATQKYVPGELLVKFKQGSSTQRRSSSLLRINATIGEQVVTDAMRQTGDNEGFYLVKTTMDPLEAMKTLRGSADIEYAEPNWIYTYDATSNDTYYTNGSLWGMYGDATSPAAQYGSQAGEAWAANHTGSKTVYIGVIDEGIQYTHPDLDANIWTNPYDPADGKDNDGNGYIDDVRGWDFANNNNSIYDGGSSGSLDKHGTHVAGTIGAERNGAGVVGINWNVTMISGKFLGSSGGTTSNAVKAVDYFTNLKTKHKLRIVATNNSWGGGGYSTALYDAIVRAAKANILFIAAAGNGGGDGIGDNNDTSPSYPASYNTQSAAGYDAVIAVASITKTGAKSGFSNYGATSVDLGAPGSGIYSTLPPNQYGSYSGTSMATPHVTGGAALYAAQNSGATAAQIKSAILNSAVPTSSLSGRTVTGGRLNVSRF
jgi:subtilisin family serine protease